MDIVEARERAGPARATDAMVWCASSRQLRGIRSRGRRDARDQDGSSVCEASWGASNRVAVCPDYDPSPLPDWRPLKRVTIHTDGGCQGNPGPGAWAAVLQYGRQELEIGGAVAATTNNRMELQAAIQALSVLNQACEIVFFTDSQYLRQGILSWIHGWKRNGWKTSTKEPVKNVDLWQRLDGLVSRHQIEWRWLKGHAGHPLNERCDVRANAEMAALRKTMSPAQLAAALSEFNRTA